MVRGASPPRESGKPDEVSVVVKRDREVVKQVQATQNERGVLARREDTADTQRVWADPQRNPAAKYTDTPALNAEEDILRTASQINAKLSLRNRRRDHGAVGTGIDEEVKRRVPSSRTHQEGNDGIGDSA